MNRDGKVLDKHNLYYKKSIKCWDEAIPLGNGNSGALIWGTARELRFSLDREDIWDVTPNPDVYAEQFTYANMVRLVKEGKMDEINRVLADPYLTAAPTKLPAGKLIFDFGCDQEVCSELVLKRAEARLTIGDRIRIRSFLHANQRVGMIQINQPRDTFSFRIENPQFGVEGIDYAVNGKAVKGLGGSNSSLKGIVYPAPEVVSEGNVSYFCQSVAQGLSYGVFAMIREQKDCVEIAYTIAASYDGNEWKTDALKRVEDVLDLGYDTLLQSHAEWWEQFWNKSNIAVPDTLFERNWYLTQYYLASASRKGGYPMPLQGVWTADDGELPPWKGDYHCDANLEMTYYSYLKANHIEEGEVLIDFLWKLMPKGREFARRFFGTKGHCLPSVMTLEGESLGGWAQYSMSPTNQLWLCQAMERHYRFTGDQKFLEEKAYPYLEECAECILELLEEKDEKYYLPISTSPEIHDDKLEAYLTPNTNYDLALMRYLFKTLVEYSGVLKDGKEERWNHVLECLPELAVNRRNALMLSPDEELRESHRHHSHAMAIHPLRLLSYENPDEQKVIDATVAELEILGSGLWTGFAFPWMAEFYAIQKNGNGAARQLELFWRDFCTSNGFHVNGDYKKTGTSHFHYRPFTIEGNFCAADALQEMLLQTEDNQLQLFPAIPDEWLEKTVAFDSFRAEKGLLVSATMVQGEVTSLILKPQYTGKVYLKVDKKMRSLLERMNEAVRVREDLVELFLEAGKEYFYIEVKANVEAD